VASLLQDLGPFPESEVQSVAVKLITAGCYEGDAIYASLLFIGETFGDAVPVKAPKRTWTNIIEFIYDRFSEFRRIKADHEQWRDSLGHQLWRNFEGAGDKDAFVSAIKSVCELR
jgi:hypothetical protein